MNSRPNQKDCPWKNSTLDYASMAYGDRDPEKTYPTLSYYRTKEEQK